MIQGAPLATWAIFGGALAAGNGPSLESLVRLAAAWLLCVPLRPETVRRSEGGERALRFVSAVVIAWLLGGTVIWIVAALWIIDSVPNSTSPPHSLSGVRAGAAHVLLPALIGWAALGGPVPLPGPARVESNLLLDVYGLFRANWLVPLTFASLAIASSRPFGRVGAAAGVAAAATAFALADRLVGAAVLGIALIGELSVGEGVSKRPMAALLVIVGAVLGLGGN